jgi:hypothetical protein
VKSSTPAQDATETLYGVDGLSYADSPKAKKNIDKGFYTLSIAYYVIQKEALVSGRS